MFLWHSQGHPHRTKYHHPCGESHSHPDDEDGCRWVGYRWAGDYINDQMTSLKFNGYGHKKKFFFASVLS